MLRTRHHGWQSLRAIRKETLCGRHYYRFLSNYRGGYECQRLGHLLNGGDRWTLLDHRRSGGRRGGYNEMFFRVFDRPWDVLAAKKFHGYAHIHICHGDRLPRGL